MINRLSTGVMIVITLAIILLASIIFNTKVVTIGSNENIKDNVFSQKSYGKKMFGKIKGNIEERAVDVIALATAINNNRKEAEKKYGISSGIAYTIPVKFTGVVGKGKSGVYYINIDGLPEKLKIRVQTGPAIMGTELRDATGDIKFGQFVNQIEYQDAGSALNNEMKKQILSKIDNKDLSGKSIYAVGVFKLINQKNWLVTPVKLEVQ